MTTEIRISSNATTDPITAEAIILLISDPGRYIDNRMSKHRAILSELRENYSRGGLTEEDAALAPFPQFDKWLDEAVDAEVVEPNAMTLATADADGRPSARIVLLKGLDEGGFCFFTNYGSRKARDLEANPEASLVIHWRELERQVIIRGTVSRTSEHESRDYFHDRPHGAKIGAWVSENQTSVIPNRAHLQQREAELLAKWPEGTEVPLPPFWGGYRVNPFYIEFWQGRPNRIHDRLSYTREDEGWKRARLSP
jgi:pyridoxamine 5'-phosphate oxidase